MLVNTAQGTNIPGITVRCNNAIPGAVGWPLVTETTNRNRLWMRLVNATFYSLMGRMLHRPSYVPAAAESTNQCRCPEGRRRDAGKSCEPSKMAFMVLRFAAPVTRKARSPLLSSAG